MKNIIFVRHGQKVENGATNDNIRKCLELTRVGKYQANSLGRYLNLYGIKVDNLFSSNLIRAVQTAEIIANEIGITNQVVDGIEERFLYPKSTTKEHITSLREMAQNDWDYAPKGGESLNECYRRFQSSVNNILDKVDEDSTSIVVTHARVLQTYLCKNFGQTNKDFCKLEVFLKATSMTSIVYGQQIPVLKYYNKTEHLDKSNVE